MATIQEEAKARYTENLHQYALNECAAMVTTVERLTVELAAAKKRLEEFSEEKFIGQWHANFNCGSIAAPRY